jgi:hypothetical protein
MFPGRVYNAMKNVTLDEERVGYRDTKFGGMYIVI